MHFCNMQNSNNDNNNNIKAKGSESKKDPGNIIPANGYQYWAAWADLLKEKNVEMGYIIQKYVVITLH